MFLNAKMRSVLDICVGNPVTDKFTTFEIIIKTSNPAFTLSYSRTRRRYNDFVWLKKLLKTHHPLCSPPELPEKNSSSSRFEPQFLVQRMKELEDWLYKIVDETLYFSDTSFHLFLQTDLTCKQIQAYTAGSLSEEVLQRAYKNCEFKQDQSTFFPTVSCEDVSGDHNKPGPPSSASAAISVAQDRRAQASPQESADSGLSVNESDSDLDSSSYESILNSEDSVLTGYPPVTEITGDLQKTSLKPGHVTPTLSDVTLKGDQSMENVTSVGNVSCDKGESEEDKKSASGSHRVEMGVIFSINS